MRLNVYRKLEECSCETIARKWIVQKCSGINIWLDKNRKNKQTEVCKSKSSWHHSLMHIFYLQNLQTSFWCLSRIQADNIKTLTQLTDPKICGPVIRDDRLCHKVGKKNSSCSRVRKRLSFPNGTKGEQPRSAESIEWLLFHNKLPESY